jgi:hypothetical protein
MLKLFMESPSDVYSNVFWSANNSTQSVPRHSDKTLNVFRSAPAAENSKAGTGVGVGAPSLHSKADVAAPTNILPDDVTSTDSGKAVSASAVGKVPKGPTTFPFTSNSTTPVGRPNVETYKLPDRSKAIPADSVWPVVSVPIIVPSG